MKCPDENFFSKNSFMNERNLLTAKRNCPSEAPGSLAENNLTYSTGANASGLCKFWTGDTISLENLQLRKEVFSEPQLYT